MANWKRIKCVLTGGCMYKADEMLFTYTPSCGFDKAKYHIYNECVKCGKPIKGEIPAVLVDKLLISAAYRERKDNE